LQQLRQAAALFQAETDADKVFRLDLRLDAVHLTLSSADGGQ
jgi:hypothetical protein